METPMFEPLIVFISFVAFFMPLVFKKTVYEASILSLFSMACYGFSTQVSLAVFVSCIICWVIMTISSHFFYFDIGNDDNECYEAMFKSFWVVGFSSLALFLFSNLFAYNVADKPTNFTFLIFAILSFLYVFVLSLILHFERKGDINNC